MWLFAAIAVADEPAELRVELQGLQDERGGTVYCALFQEATGFPSEPGRALQHIVATDGACAFRASPGDYAVTVGHDENGDGGLDTNFVGMPTEGWGTSNNVVPRARAPRFRESLVELPAAGRTIQIIVHY